MIRHLQCILAVVLLQVTVGGYLCAQFNPATNAYEIPNTPNLHLGVSGGEAVITGSGITCSGNTFWAVNSLGQIQEFSLNGNSVTNNGLFASAGNGRSLAFCDNLNGGSFSPTFYASSIASASASYFAGSNWNAATGNPQLPLYNAGGSLNHLYFQTANGPASVILSYNGVAYSTIYTDVSLKISVAGFGVDDAGNIFCFRGTTNDTCNFIDVISPFGVLLKRYPVALNSYHAYGCFLMNGVLYVGLGATNAYHPNVLIPFTFTPNAATQGTPINMALGNFYDLAGCSAGLPDISERPLQVTVVSTTVKCNDMLSGTATASGADGVPPYIFSWSNGINAATATNLNVGMYSVTVTDQTGNTVSANVNVDAATNPNVIVTVDKAEICPNDSAYLCAVTNSSGNLTFHWNSGETTPCIYARNGGGYYVTVTDVYNCSAESNHVDVHVYPPPSVSISMSGDTLQAHNAVSYQWYVNETKIISATAPTYVPNTPGIYLVQIIDSAGCSAVSSPVVISSVQSIAGENFFLEAFPNPVSDLLFVKTSGMEFSTVVLFDNTGRRLNEYSVCTPIDVSQFSTGIYFAALKGKEANRIKLLKK